MDKRQLIHYNRGNMSPGNGIHTVVTDLMEVECGFEQTIASNIRELLHIVRRKDLVIFHGFYDPTLFLLLPVLKMVGVRSYVKPHGSLTKNSLGKGRVKKTLFLLLFILVKLLIKDILYINLEEKEHSVFSGRILPNWLNMDFKPSMTASDNLILKVGVIGRLDFYHKGIDIMVEIIEKKLASANVEFHIYGDGTGRKIVENLKAKYPEKIFLHGPYDRRELSHILSNIDRLALFSRHEGLPTTILEAFACATPVLATKWCNASSFKNFGVIQIFEDANSFWNLIENEKFENADFESAYESFAVSHNNELITEYISDL